MGEGCAPQLPSTRSHEGKKTGRETFPSDDRSDQSGPINSASSSDGLLAPRSVSCCKRQAGRDPHGPKASVLLKEWFVEEREGAAQLSSPLGEVSASLKALRAAVA